VWGTDGGPGPDDRHLRPVVPPAVGQVREESRAREPVAKWRVGSMASRELRATQGGGGGWEPRARMRAIRSQLRARGRCPGSSPPIELPNAREAWRAPGCGWNREALRPVWRKHQTKAPTRCDEAEGWSETQ
jgi:hypothetical protein